MRAAVLDLGSNSFHILVAEASEDGAITPILREREMLHLGAVVTEHGHIPDANADAAVATVAHFVELARRTGADPIMPVATSALRDATNGPEVVARLSEAAGTPVRVVDGETEARLGYRGVRASVVPRAEPVLVMDLGGGSLEFAIGEGDEVQWSATLPLGVGRIAASVVQNDPPTRKDRQRVQRHVDDALAPILRELERRDIGDVVAVGGTVRALARVIAVDAAEWLPASLNMFRVSAPRFDEWAERLSAMTYEERLAVEGMKDTRADHLHVAALIMSAVLERCGIADLVVSDWGMREGALRDAFGLPLPPSGEALRANAVRRLRNLFVAHDPHLDHVATLSLRIFDDLQELHGLGPEARVLLEHGALLHDLGEAIALRQHHKHSAYLIEHSEIRGFSPGEVGVLCSLARFHKSRGTKLDFPAYAALGTERREIVDKLLPLLQIADGLDRSRDQAVQDVTVTLVEDAVEVRLHGNELHTAFGEVLRKTDLFHRTYGLPVRLVDVDADDASAA